MAAGDKLLLESGVPTDNLDLENTTFEDLLLEAAGAPPTFEAAWATSSTTTIIGGVTT